MTTLEQRLQQQVESALAEFVAGGRAVVKAAMQRALAAQETAAPNPRRGRGASKRLARRSPQELQALSERLYEAIAEHPGQTMTTLSRQLGQTAAALQVAVVRLRSEQRIRTAGQRQFMRYFPMAK